MKIWENCHTFAHSWAKVTTANWQKYPNPFNPAVVSTDVIDRHVKEDGTLVTHRIIQTSFNLPGWVEQIIGNHSCFVSEISEIDPVNQVMTIRSRNVTLDSYLIIEETIKYASADNQHTLMEQEAQVTIPNLRFGVSKLENVVTDTIASNASRGREALEHVIKCIEEEVRDFSTATTFPGLANCEAAETNSS